MGFSFRALHRLKGVRLPLAPAPTAPSGAYASAADLAGLEHAARDFSFLPRQPVHSLLAGRRASRVRGRGLAKTRADFEKVAREAVGLALETAGHHGDAIGYTATTGLGRYALPFRDIQITDLTCGARGAATACPEARFVLDIGAQCSRAIRLQVTRSTRKPCAGSSASAPSEREHEHHHDQATDQPPVLGGPAAGALEGHGGVAHERVERAVFDQRLGIRHLRIGGEVLHRNPECPSQTSHRELLFSVERRFRSECYAV